jgi:uridine kinase
MTDSHAPPPIGSGSAAAAGPSDLEVLGRNPLLGRLATAEIDRLVEVLDQVAVVRGTEIVAEATIGKYMYFVLEGEARMHHSQMGLWSLGPGDHFGELALIGVKYTSTVESTTTMRLARLSRARYLALGEEHAALALHFTQSLVTALGGELGVLIDRVGNLLRTRSLPRRSEVQLKIGAQRVRAATGTPARRLLPARVDGRTVIAALHDHKPISLDFPVVSDGTLEPLTLGEWDGRDIYRRSVGLALLEAVDRVAPERIVTMGPSVSAAQVVRVHAAPGSYDAEELARRLTHSIEQLVVNGVPFREELWTVSEARHHFEEHGWTDTASGLRERRDATVPLSTLGRVVVLSTGALLPHTGMIEPFALAPHPEGLILDFGDALRSHFPWSSYGVVGDPVRDEVAMPRFGGEMALEQRRWLESMGVTGVGTFNEFCISGRVSEVIRVSEGFHEKRIARIADLIAERSDRVRVIAIAGPTSSGKTTFIKRLTVQLEVNGIRPLQISLDDYYVDRERTPKDRSGEYDFEAFEAIDHALLRDHLRRLLDGESVRTAKYDFVTGQSLPQGGKEMQLSEKSVLLCEGIHGLNPALFAESVRAGEAFRIFIHPATTLPLDRLSVVAPPDLRLLRRIVRDRHARGYRATENIARWSSVRRGEQLHIFPYLRHADVVFDSSLVYEPSVIKVYAERYLLEVPEGDPSFTAAFRLRQLLDRFVTIYPDHVPPTSILREFIGESGFEY